MAISNLDTHDIFVIVHLAGILSAWLGATLVWQFLATRKQKRQQLIRNFKYLTKSTSSVVTVADLVFETGYSPKECQKFLNKLAIELDADIDYTESGKLYYKFPVTSNLGLKEEEKYKKLVRWTEFCANHNNGIVTAVDLSLKAEVSPKECKKFLDDFIAEVRGEIECTEKGQFLLSTPYS
ncbi:MAG: hypothetical protein QNJ32_02200 [Xenococcaceae cyanobacterium MO_167.B27]|nr:hypothetical protein [Xenococcaceae cyanobacterium MO_167.B27]